MDKEKRSGQLSNEEIERENRMKDLDENKHHGCSGSQDTGDQVVRDGGTVIQRNDGLPPEQNTSENKSVEHDFD